MQYSLINMRPSVFDSSVKNFSGKALASDLDKNDYRISVYVTFNIRFH